MIKLFCARSARMSRFLNLYKEGKSKMIGETQVLIKNWSQLKDFYYNCFEQKNIAFAKTKNFKVHDISIFEGRKLWIFRGQNSDYSLQTTLERSLEKLNKGIDQAWDFEQLLLKEFKRQAPNYLSYLPDDEDQLAWLALLRHYEGPTRLLDFTYSFYVAAHLALDINAKKSSESSIWAIDTEWCKEKSFKILKIRDNNAQPGKDFKQYNSKLFPSDSTLEKAYVCPLTPSYLNPRLAAQQGNFLMPGKISETFSNNLLLMKGRKNPPFVKLSFNVMDLREEGFKDLMKMNISNRTLFPDLVGFSKSLETKLLLH